MRAATQQWIMFIGLISVVLGAMGSMTYTLNARIDALEARLDKKIDALDEKFDELDEKFDQLLIALAGRGVILPAKPVGKHSGAGK